MSKKLLDDLQAKLGQIMSTSPAKDIERNIRAVLTQAVSRLDVVTAEEYEVQKLLIARLENKILSLGYNGMPLGCPDDEMPWDREGEPLDTKYMYVCHAELNAILNNAHGNLKGARVYVTLFPCNECAKAIIQSGIAEIIYLSDKYHDSDISVASRFLLNRAGVRFTPYTPTGREVGLTL